MPYVKNTLYLTLNMENILDCKSCFQQETNYFSTTAPLVKITNSNIINTIPGISQLFKNQTVKVNITDIFRLKEL